MSQLFRLKKNEKGQSMVEFALVLPVLLLILIGIIDFGWAFNGKITLTSAAREGARVAAIIKDVDTAKTAVKNTSKLSGLSVTNDDIKIEYIDGGLDDVDKVKITINVEMEPLVGLFITEPIEMESIAFMRVE